MLFLYVFLIKDEISPSDDEWDPANEAVSDKSPKPEMEKKPKCVVLPVAPGCKCFSNGDMHIIIYTKESGHK